MSATGSMTRGDVWAALGEGLSKSDMDRRLAAAISQRGWQETIRILAKKGSPINGLKVIEIGCGTGTMALAFGILGADVTLLDYNTAVLRRAADMHKNYGCFARQIEADCVSEPPGELKGAFDVVISSGLAEHFTGMLRQSCLKYHRELCRDGGIALITVPNRLNLLYWAIRAFRSATGTWTIDVEEPFSPGELRTLADRAGFRECYTMGYVGFIADVADNVKGFGYAVADSLPPNAVLAIKRSLPARAETDVVLSIEERCRKLAASITASAAAGESRKKKTTITDLLVSNIALVAFA